MRGRRAFGEEASANVVAVNVSCVPGDAHSMWPEGCRSGFGPRSCGVFDRTTSSASANMEQLDSWGPFKKNLEIASECEKRGEFVL